MRVTHEDIARQLGCDKSTVSLALRDHPRISAATRRRVKAMAARLGYRPDPGFSLLARQRWTRGGVGSGMVLAYLVRRQHASYQHMQAPFLPGALERAAERGVQLLEYDMDEYPNARAAGRVLFHRGIRGVIVSYIPAEEQASSFALEWPRFTAITLWHGWGRMPLHAVGKDVFESTRIAWREVADRGYRRIGAALLNEAPTSLVDASRLGASYVAQQELVPPEHHVPFLLSGFEDRAAFLAWYRHYRPEVIIGRNLQLYEWLVADGVRVPRDVAYASLNVPERGKVAGASAMHREIGMTLVDHLLAQLQENRWGVPMWRHSVKLDPVWFDGPSLPPRRDTARR